MPYGEKARRQHKEWWGKRPFSGRTVSYNAGVNKFYKRQVAKIERRQSKNICKEEVRELYLRIASLCLCVLFSTISFAQCAHDDLPDQTFVMGFAPRTTEVYTIPIVFHVMHANETGNVSDEIIYSIVDELNEAYEEHNIQFCLATNDPYKRPHSGINRVNVRETYPTYGGVTTTSCAGNPNLINQIDVAALLWWPPQHAYQVWITPATYNGCQSIGGWAYFPSGQPWDGAFIPAWILSNEQNRRFIMAHEIGHGLSLFHTFHGTASCTSETNCDLQGDQICDTAPHSVPTNTGCTTAHCGVDPTNFMDYGLNCGNHFTDGQAQRMRNAIQTTVRWQAVNSGACGCPFDFDGDGVVTVNDLMTFLSLYGQIYVMQDMLNLLAAMGCTNE